MDYPVPYRGKDPYIFVSYSHRNSEQVLGIIETLQKHKFRVWYDDGIHPGAEWDDDIAQHVTGCTWFVALISRAYLDSDNCRDELFYARKLGKRRLLIYLEDVELPAAMDMRMNRLQAIFWNRYEDAQDAMDKFLETEEIELCRDLEALQAEREAARKAEHEAKVRALEEAAKRKEQAKRAQETASDDAPAEVPQGQPAAAEEKPEPKPAEPPKEKKAAGKKSRLAVIAIAAAVVIIAAIVIVAVSGKNKTAASSATQTTANTTAAAASTTAANTAAPAADKTEEETGNYRTSLLWGSHVYSDDVTAYAQNSSTEFQQLEMSSGDSYEMTLLPVQIAAAPDYPGYLLISFVDRYAVSYSFYGAYTIEGTTLQISEGEPGHLDDALALWGAEDASPLKQELTYEISIENGRCKIADQASEKYVKLASEGEVTEQLVTLSGSASDKNHMYDDIAGLEITINIAKAVCDIQPVVMLADGGQSTDATMYNLWVNTATFELTWKTEKRPYNGRTEEFDVNRTEFIHYYSTEPYGFVITDGSEVYYYQASAEAAEAEGSEAEN